MLRYTLPEKLYNALLNNAEEAVRGGAIIDFSERYTAIEQEKWNNILLDRFIKFKIIDGYYSDQFQKFTSVETNEVERLKGATKLLAFDTKWLRSNRTPAKDTVYTYWDGDVELKYHMKLHNSKKLIVIFQSRWTDVEAYYRNIGQVTHAKYDEISKKDRFEFFKFARGSKEYDFLFIEDDFNGVMGYYTTNYGSYIQPNVAAFIRKFVENGEYEEVISLGGSKGGYAAYHIAKDMDIFTRLVLISPILSMRDFFAKPEYPHDEKFMMRGNEELFATVESREKVKPTNTDIVILTAESDYQWQAIHSLQEENTQIRIVAANPTYTHAEVFKLAYFDFLVNELGLTE